MASPTLTPGEIDRHRWLTAEFDRRGPWITQFRIDGQLYGGKTLYEADPRLTSFYQHVPDRSRILEIGALEGGHSFVLAQDPNVTEIIAIEGKRENIER